jgi:hypothetical protein
MKIYKMGVRIKRDKRESDHIRSKEYQKRVDLRSFNQSIYELNSVFLLLLLLQISLSLPQREMMEIGKEVRVGNATHRNEEKNALIDEQKGRKGIYDEYDGGYVRATVSFKREKKKRATFFSFPSKYFKFHSIPFPQLPRIFFLQRLLRFLSFSTSGSNSFVSFLSFQFRVIIKMVNSFIADPIN